MRSIRQFGALFGLSLLLAACGGGGGQVGVQPPVNQDSSLTTAQGRVVNWTRGAATVVLPLGSSTSASAALDASGRFSLPLPSAGQVSSLLVPIGEDAIIDEDGCAGSLQSSDASARTASFTELAVRQGNSTIGSIIAATYDERTSETPTSATVTITVDGNAYMYADRPVTVSGSLTCADVLEGIPVTVTFRADLNLLSGWNAINNDFSLTVTATETAASGNGVFTIGGAVSGETSWTFGAPATALSSGLASKMTAKLFNRGSLDAR